MEEKRGKKLLAKYHQMANENGGELEYGTREYRRCEYSASMIDICFPARNPYVDWAMIVAANSLEDFPSEFSEDDLLDIMDYFFNKLIISMKKNEKLKEIVANEDLINYWNLILETKSWLTVRSCANIKFKIVLDFIQSHTKSHTKSHAKSHANDYLYEYKFIERFLEKFFR